MSSSNKKYKYMKFKKLYILLNPRLLLQTKISVQAKYIFQKQSSHSQSSQKTQISKYYIQKENERLCRNSDHSLVGINFFIECLVGLLILHHVLRLGLCDLIFGYCTECVFFKFLQSLYNNLRISKT